MKLFGQKKHDNDIQKALKRLRSDKIPYLEWISYKNHLSNDVYALNQNDSYFELAKALVAAKVDYDVESSIYVVYLPNVDKEAKKEDRIERVAKAKEELSRFIEATESIAEKQGLSKSSILYGMIKDYHETLRIQSIKSTVTDPVMMKKTLLHALNLYYPNSTFDLDSREEENTQPDEISDDTIGEHKQDQR